MEDLIKTRFDPSTSNLRWLPINTRGDLTTEVAFDPDGRMHQRQRSISDLNDAALSLNQSFANHTDGYMDRTRTMRREAHLTPATIMWLREEKGIDVFNPDHMEGLRRLLNDPEYRYLRTSPGRM